MASLRAGLLVLVCACCGGAPPARPGHYPGPEPPLGNDAEQPRGDVLPAPDAAARAPDAVPPPSNDVHGTAWLNVTTHCGGAMPRPGEALGYRKQVAGRKLYVRAGSSSGAAVADVTSDEHGDFALHLADGAYCLIDAERADSKIQASQYVDGQCLAAWKAQCDATFTVPRGEPLVVELQKGCFGPCYRGPLPP